MESWIWELNTHDANAYLKEINELTAEEEAEVTEHELHTEYDRKWTEAWATELEDEDLPF